MKNSENRLKIYATTRKNWRSFWFALVLALFPSPEGLSKPPEGATPTCDPQNPSKCSLPLAKGATTPFSGQLLTPELAIDLGQKAYFCDERLDLTLKFERAKLQVDLDLEKQLRVQDREAWEAKEKVLMRELGASRSRPFYEHPLFVATVSVVLTVGVVWTAKEVLEAQN